MDNDLHLMLGRVEGKLDALIAASVGLTERVNVLAEDQNKLHTRVTVLEARRSVIKEWSAILISLVAASAAAIASFKGFFH